MGLKRREPCATCGGGMSGYASTKTGKLFRHGCDICAGINQILAEDFMGLRRDQKKSALTELIQTRVSGDIYKILCRRADKDGLSVAAFVRKLVIEDCKGR